MEVLVRNPATLATLLALLAAPAALALAEPPEDRRPEPTPAPVPAGRDDDRDAGGEDRGVKDDRPPIIDRRSEEGTVARVRHWFKENHLLGRMTTPGQGWHGFRPKVGGVRSGSGLALGVQYDKLGLGGGKAEVSSNVAASVRSYELADLRLTFPSFLRREERLFLTAYARYRNFPQEDFYGLGPDSSEDDRTSFRYEDATVELGAGFRPRKWLTLGGGVGYIDLNVGRGTDDRFPSAEEQFDDAQAPGIDLQPSFVGSHVYAEVDYRDVPGRPKWGGYYRLAVTRFDARGGNLFDFRRYAIELQQYLSFSRDDRRTIALRALGTFDDAMKGHRIPFYLENTLGGGSDLRAFHDFRFRDRYRLLFNLEYRREVWKGLDLAAFADAGKVFGDIDELDLGHLKFAWGGGLRIKNKKEVLLRLDLGHGDEGTLLYIRFGPVFKPRSLL
jgi:hypothetical protein